MEDKIKKTCIALSILLVASLIGNAMHFLPNKTENSSTELQFNGKTYEILGQPQSVEQNNDSSLIITFGKDSLKVK